MDTIGIRQLKSHLSEYVRRVQAGEKILVSSHGKVVAVLAPPHIESDDGVPNGIMELSRRGTARNIVRNDRVLYRPHPQALVETTSSQLLDWDRGDG